MPKAKNLNAVLSGAALEHEDFIVRVAQLLGTSRFIIGLTMFFGLWIGGNLLADHFLHKAIDPAPFLLVSTTINIYSAYTISILLKADRAERAREKIANDHKAKTDQLLLDYTSEILRAVRHSHKDLKSTIIQSAPDKV